ncbi:glutathione S-transferase family protein [Piscinibacter sp.]|jgi:glutathione S-transferase|uniref:glutathione S-transferase family protein n=1 Tax=Piscinibacter sp. TaxID=1903157 RepID=UPI001DA77B27|nr:glutathione S-transferase family protein [Piscinibacter sp.]MBK7532309.1 glutathione S-transferase family protein [Piscinibacter sp.]MCC7066623.1 glutathione S-transferase family protein [Planctomycetota bacterium]
MRLYDYELSGNCYKVRFLLHALGIAYERHSINFFPGREHKSDQFLSEVNPLGQIPVLEDDGLLLRDAQAILVYLASRYDKAKAWYPDDACLRGEIQVWLATADEITRTASAARLHDALGYTQFDIEACRAGAHEVFRVIDDHLSVRQAEGAQWLVGDRPTVADIACFPYIALAGEGGISIDGYPALRQWLWHFRSQPRFIGMAGIMALDLTHH